MPKIEFECTSVEHQRLARQAKNAGVSVDAWVRRRLGLERRGPTMAEQAVAAGLPGDGQRDNADSLPAEALYAVYARKSATSKSPFSDKVGTWTALNGTSLAHLGMPEVMRERRGDGSVLMSFEDAHKVAKECPSLEAGEYRVHSYVGGFGVELSDSAEH